MQCHPGYGFLSGKYSFAKRCEEEGIIFIGAKNKHLDYALEIKWKQEHKRTSTIQLYLVVMVQ